MKVYLAAAYAARDALRVHVADLAAHGITVTSSWLREGLPLTADTLGAAPGRPTAEIVAHSEEDFADIDAADALVVFTGDSLKPYVAADLPELKLHTGGRHVETGYALAKGLPVIVVGTPENVFQRGLCQQADTWDDAVRALTVLAARTDAPAA